MWRTDGQGELYAYLPPDFPSNTDHTVCTTPPKSVCNPEYGSSFGRGSFNFTTGARTYIAERVLLNDVTDGQAVPNGELQLFVNGTSLFTLTGLVLTNSTEGRIRGMQMQTFFGGESRKPRSCRVMADGFIR